MNRFEQPVLDLTKIHTFRLDPKKRWKVGNPIQFYVNARQKTMRKFREDGICKAVQSVRIVGIRNPKGFKVIVTIGDNLTTTVTKTFAKNDGFASVEEFRQCLIKIYPDDYAIDGYVIHWTDFKY